MARRFGGLPLIIAATAVAGIAGYLVIWLVYRGLGPASYAVFAVFWAALYIVIGALSGIQQEITRATKRIEIGERSIVSRARNFALVTAAGVLFAVLASAYLWVGLVFPSDGWSLVWPLALGAASYVLVATLSGSLYGIQQWGSLALMISLDGVLRLVLLGFALLFTQDVITLAWLVAVPFPLTVMILWPLFRGGFAGRSDIDVGYRALTWNVARTVLAAASTAVLVSGFPLLLGVAAGGTDPGLLGEVIFTVTLTRAPLIVSVMALQSYLVVRFRDGPERGLRLFGGVCGIIALGAALLAILGWWLGPAVLGWVAGFASSLSGGYIAMLVLSSALVACLSVSGSVILARGNHFAYSVGWAMAALATVVAILWPMELLSRTAVALLVGPLAGMAVHLIWLARGVRRARRRV